MSHPNPERDGRVRQIRANLDTAKAEKTRYRYYEPPTWDDVELLLSLLDSQATEIAAANSSPTPAKPVSLSYDQLVAKGLASAPPERTGVAGEQETK